MPDRAYWIGVAARQHVDMGVKSGFCMFAHGRHDAVEKVKSGDRFAYYAPMNGMGTGGQVRAFVAIGEVLDEPPEAQAMGPGVTGWRRPAKYFAGHDADVYPLLDRLSFIKDAKTWGIAFHRSLFKIKQTDFALIAEAMGATDANQDLSQ